MRSKIEVIDECHQIRDARKLAAELGDEHRFAVFGRVIKPGFERTSITFDQFRFRAVRGRVEAVDESRRKIEDELAIVRCGWAN